MGEPAGALVNVLRIEHLLIDYENAQRFLKIEDIQQVETGSVRVTIFYGPVQKRIELDVAAELQRIGFKVQYVKVKKPGKQALDLHLACYLGQFLQEQPNSRFHVIAEDDGYTSLIEHLRENGVQIDKHSNISAIPLRKEKDRPIANLLPAASRFIEEMNPRPTSVAELCKRLGGRFHINKKKRSELLELLGERVRMKQDGTVEYDFSSRITSSLTSPLVCPPFRR